MLLIDNYDSFVYNLSRYFVELGCRTRVVRNDEITVEEVRQLRPRGVVLSPGPCTPAEAGVCVELVRELAGEIPILGVCLGHQAIAAAFGARIIRAAEPVHGRTSRIDHSGEGIFAGMPNPLTATRYHSLIVDEQTLPTELAVTARTAEGVPMAIAHRRLPLFGLQFHPESVLTDSGHRLLRNFLAAIEIDSAAVPGVEYSPPAAEAEWIAAGEGGEVPLHW